MKVNRGRMRYARAWAWACGNSMLDGNAGAVCRKVGSPLDAPSATVVYKVECIPRVSARKGYEFTLKPPPSSFVFWAHKCNDLGSTFVLKAFDCSFANDERSRTAFELLFKSLNIFRLKFRELWCRNRGNYIPWVHPGLSLRSDKDRH